MSEVIEIQPNSGAENALTPMEMLNNAVMGGADTETLERLMSLQERWEANQARKAFDNAMADLRADLPEIIKSSTVDYTHKGQRTYYKYADLNAVTKALSKVMAQHGLSFRWRTDQGDGGVMVTCVISHRDGHYEETSLKGSPDSSAGKNSIQSVGSTVTYLQRYTLKAAVGVAAAHDDDGVQSQDGASQSTKTPSDEADPLIKMIDSTASDQMEGLNKRVQQEAKKRKLSGPAFKLVQAHYSARLKREKEMANA